MSFVFFFSLIFEANPEHRASAKRAQNECAYSSRTFSFSKIMENYRLHFHYDNIASALIFRKKACEYIVTLLTP